MQMNYSEERSFMLWTTQQTQTICLAQKKLYLGCKRGPLTSLLKCTQSMFSSWWNIEDNLMDAMRWHKSSRHEMMSVMQSNITDWLFIVCYSMTDFKVNVKLNQTCLLTDMRKAQKSRICFSGNDGFQRVMTVLKLIWCVLSWQQ